MRDRQNDGGKVIPFLPRVMAEAAVPHHEEQNAIGICLDHLGRQARDAGLQITARLIAAAALAAREECSAEAESSAS